MYMITYKKGFTLIELLVVIAIIGILSSVVLASLNGARIKSRDVKRKEDMVQVRTALELYYNDNGSYPLGYGSGWAGINAVPCGTANGTVSGANAYISGLTPKYIPVLPTDPSGVVGTCTGYMYYSDGNNYKLVSHQVYEETYPTVGQSFYDPVRPTWALALCSNDTACNAW